jgi:hypothetical protein
MDQFELMIDYLDNSRDNYFKNVLLSNEEVENSSLAFVESTLLHGYQIAEPRQYKTTTKKVTELVK